MDTNKNDDLVQAATNLTWQLSQIGDTPDERLTIAKLVASTLVEHFRPELTLQEKLYKKLHAHEMRSESNREAEWAKYYETK
jgi:hypothetical protein